MENENLTRNVENTHELKPVFAADEAADMAEEKFSAGTSSSRAPSAEQSFSAGHAPDTCVNNFDEAFEAMFAATEAWIEGAFALNGDAMSWWSQTFALMTNGSTTPWFDWMAQFCAGYVGLQESMMKVMLQQSQAVPRLVREFGDRDGSATPFAWMWNSCELGMDILLGAARGSSEVFELPAKAAAA
jgi:hypothetical protein